MESCFLYRSGFFPKRGVIAGAPLRQHPERTPAPRQRGERRAQRGRSAFRSCPKELVKQRDCALEGAETRSTDRSDVDLAHGWG